MRSIPAMLTAGALVLAVILPTRAQATPGDHLGAGILAFADPNPAAGLSYEWSLSLKKREKAGFVWYVGAKSWSEPSNPDGLKGWTHTANWVAIELAEPAVLAITVERQGGVVYTAAGVQVLARGALVPALSLYAGWDDTTEFEEHNFDNAGDFWATIDYLGNQPNLPNRKGETKTRISYKTKKLPAGRYTLVIGGNPPVIASYPDSGCDPNDATCYAYTGPQGYRATIEAR